jgi:tRNA threonylcarbamoyladenosine biosynthesis protein TsaB
VRVLAVHSTSPYLGVAVAEDSRILVETILPPSRKHLEQVAVLVRDVLAEAGLTLPDLDGFGVAVGPGSFSGIRIGMALVKGLALALHKPVAGLSSLEILARQDSEPENRISPIIDAKRGEVYTALYQQRSGAFICLSPPSMMAVDQFPPDRWNTAEGLIVCGDTTTAGLRIDMPGMIVKRPVVASPGICAIAVADRLVQLDHQSVHAVAPLYLRRSDAEENLAARSPGSV